MERKLVRFETVDELLPIKFINKETQQEETASAIELIKIKGWQVVAQKGLYKPGQKLIYCEIDSLLPELPVFDFLAPRGVSASNDGSKGYRIKTMKLKGALSQGICFPLEILKEMGISYYEGSNAIQMNKDDIRFVAGIGDDISEFLGIKKWEPYIPAQLQGVIRGNFPGFLRKTDEERVQNLPWIFEQFKDEIFYETEKIDGTSVTFYFKDDLFGVCSRNLDLKESEDNLYWKMARQFDIENKLKSIGSYAIQGEIYGNGVQKNKYKLTDVFFACFNIFDIENQTYLNLQELKNMSLQLNIPLVPIINENFKLPNTLDDLLKYVSGPSILNPSSLREGSVFRPLIEKEVRGLGRLSFKAVSNEFLLKHGD